MPPFFLPVQDWAAIGECDKVCELSCNGLFALYARGRRRVVGTACMLGPVELGGPVLGLHALPALTLPAERKIHAHYVPQGLQPVPAQRQHHQRGDLKPALQNTGYMHTACRKACQKCDRATNTALKKSGRKSVIAR